MRIGLRQRNYLVAYLCIAPAVIGILVFGLIPLAYAGFISLHEYAIVGGTRTFLGLGNYASLVKDPLVWKSLWNTTFYALMLVPMQTGLGFLLALALYRRFKGVIFFRTTFYLPVVISMVVASTVFRIIYNPDNGILNSILGVFRIPPQPFHTSPSQALPSLAFMSTWKWVGTTMLIFIGGLNDIPETYYEAAKIDGASDLKQLFSITLPLLKRVTLFVLTINLINAFKIFTPIYVITNGGPNDATLASVFYIFITAFRYYHMGYAAAVAFVLLAIVMVLTLVQFRLMRSEA